ncbi:MAG: S1/P1 nuclease [Bacteroidales bacterium]|nr:S1/P1 nuclease [Bacteroidales bacterium]
MRHFHCISIFLCLCTGILSSSTDAMAWGPKGHDVTCSIASRHLTARARKQIDCLLDGKSIVYWANWMDNASHTPEYAYTKTWHYKDVDVDESFEDSEINENGDLLTAIYAQISALKSGELNKEAAATSLKMLVHLVGDLHCPMHLAHKSDYGGNRWQVQYFGNGKNLHSIWDTPLIESSHNWTFSEWATEIDRVDRRAYRAIVSGTPSDWGKETYELAGRVYEGTPVGAKLSYDYVSEWAPVVEQQLLKGGLRLSAVLNDIFSNSFHLKQETGNE